MKRQQISIIVPVCNEEQAIKPFLDDMLLPELKKISDFTFEILLVNDGSTDKTLPILKQYAEKNPNIKVLSFSRNFGKEIALTAGLRNISPKSDAAIIIDSDGQQPPKLIPKFIKKWQSGYNLVVGVRDHYTKHGLIPRIGSKIFYKMLGAMGSEHTVSGSTDFRLLARPVIDEYNRLSEHNRITRGLMDWLGFECAYITFSFDERIAGKPSYNLKKLFQLAVDSFISLSTTPLVIFGYVGAIITVLSFILGLFVIIQQYILGDPLHLYWNGAVQMTIFITFLVGLVLISQAITAAYISRIHANSQGRPLYVIDQTKSYNLNSPKNKDAQKK